MKISIITVCLNSSNTISQTIESVNSQLYPNIEHIFIDGGSKDNTIDIIKSYAKRKKKIFYQNTKGIYNAMNMGIEKSKGDILLFLNSDDFIADEKVINKSMELFEKGFDIVYGDISYFKFKNQKRAWRSFKPGKYYKNAYQKGWHAPHPAFFIKKKSIKKYFDEKIEISSDFNFMFYHQEILGLKSSYLNINCVMMGIGGTSQKVSNILKGNKNIFKSINNYYPNISIYIFLLKRFIFKLRATI